MAGAIDGVHTRITRLDVVLAAIWLACLAAFIALGVYAGLRNQPGIDLHGARAVQDLPAPLGSLFDAANWLGGGWPSATITAVFTLVFLLRCGWPEAILFPLTAVPRFLQAMIKDVVQSPRPLPAQVHVDQLVSSFSYPSGHVVGTTVVFGTVFFLAPPLGLGTRWTSALRAWAVIMVLAIGPARVWAGVHWPSDVLGGYLFAALWLIPVLRIHDLLRRRRAAP